MEQFSLRNFSFGAPMAFLQFPFICAVAAAAAEDPNIDRPKLDTPAQETCVE